ncbi:reticulon-like protein b5 [Quercus suber]|uniref:Reticulon-like protein b5 n=1 Tax=Quercus suber TaxID=58331 RepID=A0AAW0JBV8_QUESU|nr:reticulon-like protein b5 [Quercus suber]
MANHACQPESMMDKIVEKIPDHQYSSSSLFESESDDKFNPFGYAKAKIYKLFGREKPVHKVLIGGKRNLFLFLFDLFV